MADSARRADYSRTRYARVSAAGEEMVMAKKRDPAEVVDTIRESIEVSKRGSRKVRAYRFRELFGYQAWSAPRREHVEKLLNEAGIVVQPPLDEAGRDDWLLMSMPTLPEVREEH